MRMALIAFEDKLMLLMVFIQLLRLSCIAVTNLFVSFRIYDLVERLKFIVRGSVLQ